MCLAIPGKIKELSEDRAIVDFSGVEREASTALVPKAKKNDWVIVHAGFAIQILDKNEAKKTLRLFNSLG